LALQTCLDLSSYPYSTLKSRFISPAAQSTISSVQVRLSQLSSAQVISLGKMATKTILLDPRSSSFRIYFGHHHRVRVSRGQHDMTRLDLTWLDIAADPGRRFGHKKMLY